MELKDTVELMLSDNWKARLKAAYYQCEIRVQELEAAIVKLIKEAGRDPVKRGDLWELRRQLRRMRPYRDVLRDRLMLASLNND